MGIEMVFRSQDGDVPRPQPADDTARKPAIVDKRFREEEPIVLSDEDRDAFLAALDSPPAPNAALKRLMSGGNPQP